MLSKLQLKHMQKETTQKLEVKKHDITESNEMVETEKDFPSDQVHSTTAFTPHIGNVVD